jgi:hypothetical protein
MCVQGRFPYQPHFADCLIEPSIPWQRWIADAPDGGSGSTDRGRGGGENRSCGYETDDSEGAGDTGISDLFETLVLKQPSSTGEWGGDNNAADCRNAHTSCFHPPQFVKHQYGQHRSSPVSLHPDQDLPLPT